MFALSAVFPIFALMAAGYVFRLKGLINQNFADSGIKLVFRFALPVLLFSNIYTAKTDFENYGRIIGFTLTTIFILFFLLLLTVPLVVKDNRRRSVIIQGLFRSNFVFLGMPMALNMFGQDGVGPTAALVTVVVPLFNLLAVIDLSIFSAEKQKNLAAKIGSVLLGIIKNPLIIASVAALLAVRFNIVLPEFLNRAISDTGKLATPLALVTLGAGFHFKRSAGNLKALLFSVAGGQIVIPAAVVVAAGMLGFRGAELGAMFAVFAAPVAATSYVMAKESGADGELAGQLVVYTTAFSCITLFVFIVIMKQLALI